MAREAPYSVRLMGRFAVDGDDGCTVLPISRKARGAFAYLLFHRGKPVPRLRLVDLFWSDRGPDQGRASLRQALYEVRRAFGDDGDDILMAEHETVAIHARRFAFDLWTEQGDYDPTITGTFLEDLDPLSPVFDDWVADIRRVIHAAQLKTAESDLADAVGAGDATKVERRAGVVLALDRANEPAARALLQALGALGKTSTAKAEFETLKAVLAEDGFEVSPETEAAYLAARRSQTTVAPPAAAPVAADERRTPVLAIRLRENGAQDTADGGAFADDLAASLARLPELQVVAGQDAHGRATDFAVEVSLKAQDDRVVCVLRLSDLRSGFLCWSMREVLGPERLQDRLRALADRNVSAILAAIERTEMRLIEGRTGELSAYEHYLRAKFRFFRAETRTYVDDVVADLEAAIAKDPSFIPAYAHLIQSYNTGLFYTRPGQPLGPGRERALEYAERLMAIDSQHANAHIAMGWCQLWKKNFVAAERCLDTAIDIGSHEAHRLNAIGTGLVYLGRADEGLAFYDRAQERMLHELDYQRSDYGELYYLRGDYVQALSWLDYGERRARYRTRFYRMVTLAQLERMSEAQDELSALVEGMMGRWSSDEPCTRETAVTWFIATTPMRRTEDRAAVEDGLARLGIRR